MKIAQISLLSTIIFLVLSSGIIRGDIPEEEYLNLAQQEQFDCVGKIIQDSTIIGSCVLINELFVLSAAHVFIESDKQIDTIDINGQQVITYQETNERVTESTKLTVLINGQSVRVKNITLHPNYLDSVARGSCDVAILEIERPYKEITLANLNTNFDELASNVVGVGYGASGSAERPDLVGFYGKKIAGENIIDSLGGLRYSEYRTELMCDFDHPTDDNFNKMGGSIPRPLEYICSGGDSGGGLFRLVGEKWELIGICAGSVTNINELLKTGYYGQTMSWTRISVFNNWINSIIE